MDNKKPRGERFQRLGRHRELVVTTVLVSIAILGSYGLVFGLTLALNNPHPFAVVDGRSMETTYYENDLVVVQGVFPSEIKIRDVIVYHQPRNYENLIIHRVINVTTRGEQLFFTAKGDNNVAPDPWLIPANYVVGRVIYHIPLIGSLFLILSSPFVDGITLGNFLSILLIAFWIFVAYRTPAQEREEETENTVEEESRETEGTI